MIPKLKEQLTPAQAAKQLNIHPETLRRYAEEGRIKSSKTKGGHRRYQIETIEELKEYQEAGRSFLDLKASPVSEVPREDYSERSLINEGYAQLRTNEEKSKLLVTTILQEKLDLEVNSDSLEVKIDPDWNTLDMYYKLDNQAGFGYLKVTPEKGDIKYCRTNNDPDKWLAGLSQHLVFSRADLAEAIKIEAKEGWKALWIKTVPMLLALCSGPLIFAATNNFLASTMFAGIMLAIVIFISGAVLEGSLGSSRYALQMRRFVKENMS